MSCKYNNCKHCGYKSECEIYKENTDLRVNLKWEQDTKLELAEHLGKVNDEISELEQQIEKMKRCENCSNTWNGYHLNVCDDCKNRDKWEIKEDD